MGYEHRIYIVRKGSLYDPILEKGYADILAKFNLGRNSDLYRLVNTCYRKETNLFICDEDKTITEDMYGKPLIEISVEELLDDLHEYVEETQTIAMLRGTLESIKDTKYIVCLHYGY